MIKKLLYGIALLASFTACTGDYTDWADPMSNAQGEVVSFGNGSIEGVGTIDLANYAAGSTVQVFNVTETPSIDKDGYTLSRYELYIDGESFGDATADGKISADELTTLVVSKFGKRPEARTMSAYVIAYFDNETAPLKVTSSEFNIVAIPEAPEIFEHLYLIGAPSAWDPTCTTMPFSHSDKDVYDDPVFTVTFPVSDGDTWFALADDKTVETGEWSNVFGAREGNGKNLVGEKGMFTRRTDLADDGSFMVHVDGDAKFIKMTVNVLDGWYLIEKVNYSQFIYFIGSTDGWSASDQKLESPAYDGVYTGFIYVADPNGWGLAGKFQKEAGNWDTQVNAGDLTGGMTGVTGTDNIEFPAEGVYYMCLDLTQNKLEATLVTKMGIIGGFNEWSADAEMTWDAENYCYVAQNPGITSAGWKFRINADWAVNLGGTVDKLEANGANLDVVGNTVKLYPTRKTNNNIYCTVE